MVCIMRCKKYDPDITKQLVQEIVFKQNPNLKNIFDNEMKTWPLYFTPKILPSTNKKVFYIGDAFNGFLPTLAQGAGQSIESAYEIFNLLKNNKLDKDNNYFEIRSKRAKIVRSRSNFNFFVFHFSTSKEIQIYLWRQKNKTQSTTNVSSDFTGNTIISIPYFTKTSG